MFFYPRMEVMSVPDRVTYSVTSVKSTRASGTLYDMASVSPTTSVDSYVYSVFGIPSNFEVPVAAPSTPVLQGSFATFLVVRGSTSMWRGSPGHKQVDT